MLCDIALKTLERAAEVTRRRLVKSTRPTDPIETEAGIDTLCRAEDEPGSWQGGPLPGPHMIDELTDKSGGEQ